MSAESIAARARRANGIPAASDTRLPRVSRFVRNPWTWTTLVATIAYAACLVWMYVLITAPITTPDGGEVPGINASAIREAAGYAWPTLAFWIVAFVWLDRFRPQRPVLWYLSLGWGACVATAASMELNTWAARQMSIAGDNPAAGARSAIYVAPFVEEATKATVLFLIALAVRYRLVSKLQAVALAGLSAAGFAFTENILYYARAIVYASVDINTGDPRAAITQIVSLRGYWLAFGHPLFTLMTGLGLVVALRTRSKVVRVLAPLVGYLAAAGLHMTFNTVASIFGEEQQRLIYFMVALPLVLTVAGYAIRQVFVEGRRHRDRLDEFVRFGWLPESDAWVFSRQRSRWRSVLVSVTYGWRTFVATVGLQRALTELVYLRDAQIRGTVDAAADARARLLLDRVQELRGHAITDPRVQKLQLPALPEFLRWRRRPVVPAYSPGGPPLGGVGVGSPAPPVGSPQQYSPVDPRWGPPRG